MAPEFRVVPVLWDSIGSKLQDPSPPGGTTFDVFVGQTKLTEEPQGEDLTRVSVMGAKWPKLNPFTTLKGKSIKQQ